jgi:hypothetical protein
MLNQISKEYRIYEAQKKWISSLCAPRKGFKYYVKPIVRSYQSEYEGEDFINLVAPSFEESINTFDVEDFIYRLPMHESIVLLFISLGYKRKDIQEMLGYKYVSSINQIVLKMRKIHANNNLA